MLHRLNWSALAVVCALALTTVACSGAGRILGLDNSVQLQKRSLVQLNPQPEPPSLVIEYQLIPRGEGWAGSVYVGGQACGTMQLVQTKSEQTGIVMHVGYNLSIAGYNPDFQLDASLSGVIVRQHVVLNGTVGSGYYAGRTVHPRGVIQTTGGGPTNQLTTMLGTVQLNPQPEPPYPAFPPSPCIQ